MLVNTQAPRAYNHAMPSPGEHDLRTLLRSCNPTLHHEEFAYVTLPNEEVPAGIAAQATFRESEGMTLIVTRREAGRCGLQTTFPCRMITLNVHSALDAVGFVAAVMTALASRGISTNTVSAFYHDHLFVPSDRAEEALQLLREFAG
jgi:hypothetical protein